MHMRARRAADAARRRAARLSGARSLAGQLMWVQLGVVALLVGVAILALVLQSRNDVMKETERRTRSMADALAEGPGMVAALDGPDPTAALQPRAQQLRRRAHVDLVVVFSTQGVRYTHPDPKQVGKHVLGPYKQAFHGTFTRTITASTGVTVASIAPVTRADGSIAGLVSVGITVKRVESTEAAQLPLLLGGAAGILLLSAAVMVLLSRRLRRQTHGLRPAEMTRMYEHHDAVLHAVREGVLIMDAGHRLLLVNDEARRLLDLGPDAEGERVADLGLDARVVELLTSGEVSDAVALAGDRLLAVNIRPTEASEAPAGSVATLRDTTELRALTGRAEAARERLRLLHEAGIRIGTTLDVRRTAGELAEVAAPRFADVVTVELADPVLRGDEPAIPGDRLRRTAVGAADPAATPFPDGELVDYPPAAPQARALRTRERASDPELSPLQAWPEDPERAERIRQLGLRALVAVPVRARGVVLGVAAFYRNEASDPFDEDDLALAEELVGQAGVCIDNARRYTREHATAVTLQRSLLPGGLPGQDAVEAAYRYLPAQAEAAGVGGDWFDVIPLSGARVALVVGDVVGHGLQATATMGRLRTAVQNFSALDLPPDELLGYLDELVTRIDDDPGRGTAPISGATCLYAIYDPVSGGCSMVTNGHPGPALVRPDGTVSFPDIPVSPPLGVGGEPYETAELELPEGSRLVLFTDGLVTDRHRDLDTGVERLREALSRLPDGTPEETCQGVLDAVLPPRPADDVALLVARTRRLGAEHIAEWAVDGDPTGVARIRTEAAARLAAWGLAESAPATELILSELITNAIRHGALPARVRLMRARSLICEVADGSTTAPHLRRAASTDEGGRGLYLVSRFAERWGTRYLSRGKIVWTEQPLVADASPQADVSGEDLLDQWDDSAR